MTKKKTTTTEIKIVSDADKHAFEDRDPFEDLARHRTNHPNEPVPSKLEFAAIVEQRLTPSVNVEAIVDGQIAEESGPGRPDDADRIARCRRMDELVDNGRVSITKASIQLEGELEREFDRDSIEREYRRYMRKRIDDLAGQAVVDDDEQAFVDNYRALEKRDKRKNQFESD